MKHPLMTSFSYEAPPKPVTTTFVLHTERVEMAGYVRTCVDDTLVSIVFRGNGKNVWLGVWVTAALRDGEVLPFVVGNEISVI